MKGNGFRSPDAKNRIRGGERERESCEVSNERSAWRPWRFNGWAREWEIVCDLRVAFMLFGGRRLRSTGIGRRGRATFLFYSQLCILPHRPLLCGPLLLPVVFSSVKQRMSKLRVWLRSNKRAGQGEMIKKKSTKKLKIKIRMGDVH